MFASSRTLLKPRPLRNGYNPEIDFGTSSFSSVFLKPIPAVQLGYNITKERTIWQCFFSVPVRIIFRTAERLVSGSVALACLVFMATLDLWFLFISQSPFLHSSFVCLSINPTSLLPFD